MAVKPALTITFHKVMDVRPHAWWEATRKTGGTIRGGYMPIGRGVIPHDLAHYAVEVHLRIDDGFWGLLARGATFKRGTDRRATRQGRTIVAEHRTALTAAENLGNFHHGLWMRGESTPVAPTFDRLADEWAATADGGALTVCWPGLASTLRLASSQRVGSGS